ncbi:MAG: DUF6600 domain-containing protein, partial [Pyrinomonadaceae bacterium]
TWVSNEPWGYAPYHYGRWANLNNQWYWIPDGVNTTPSYAPALVAFVPVDDNQIGWVPLGPGDVYAPRYYDDNWRVHYLSGSNIVPTQLVNFGIPGAVTVVPVDAFGRAIDPRSIKRFDQQRLAAYRPTFDPFSLTPLRNAAIHSAWGRGKIDLPPGIAKKLRDTPVYVGADFKESRFRKDMAKSMRVERVSDDSRKQKFKVKDNREQALQVDSGGKQDKDSGRKQSVETGGRQDIASGRKQGVESGGKQRVDRGIVESPRANKEAQRQVRQVEQQQRQEARPQANTKRNSQQQAQGERVSMPAQPRGKENKGAGVSTGGGGNKGGGAKPAGGGNKGGGQGKGKGKP